MVDQETLDSEEAASDEVDLADEEESDGESNRGQSGRRGKRRPANPETAAELLTDYLAYQADRAALKLRQSLVGTIGIQIAGAKQNFLVNWSGEEFQSSETDQIENVDCRMKISEDDLLDIARGKLNPQVAMLSHKIHISGNLNLAMYFFNLFAARARQ